MFCPHVLSASEPNVCFLLSACLWCVLTELISKIKEPPPLCRPILSVDEAPLDIIQVVKQAWCEEPERRPTFEEIFKQVQKILNTHFNSDLRLLLNARDEISAPLLFHVAVQEHHQGKEDQHH